MNNPQKKIDPIIPIIIGVTLIILVVGVVWAMKSTASTTPPTIEANQSTSLNLSATSHDWGSLPIDGGDVTKVFEITNTGSSDLTLANFTTSCMCTTVKVTTKSESSPLFGMHDKSNWLGTIKPGESGQITVVFDPDFHGPQGKGQITRIIKFNTNDPTRQEVELTLTGIVI